MAPPNKIKFTKEEIKERARKVGALKGAQQVRKKAKKAQVKKFQKTSKSYPTEGDRDFRSGFTKSGEETQKLGRKPKVAPSDKPLRGSGNYMSQSDKDMNAAKKKGDVKEQTRLKNVQKSIEANKKAAKLKGVGGGGNRGRGKPIELQEKLLVRKSALKKNKGGVMKKRGGSFKGVR